MFTLEEIFVRTRVDRQELDIWIERSWVRPVRDERGWRFSETDLARVEMLCDLIHDLGLDREALDVVLPLLDQVYDLRRTVRVLTEAIGDLPQESRERVIRRLARN